MEENEKAKAERWQKEWKDRREKASRTRKLIRGLERWAGRKNVNAEYFLPQFLTGHGYYARYLKRMGIRKITPAGTVVKRMRYGEGEMRGRVD